MLQVYYINKWKMDGWEEKEYPTEQFLTTYISVYNQIMRKLTLLKYSS
jgi:hypothetical protein